MKSRELKTSPNRFCAAFLALALLTLACSADDRQPLPPGGVLLTPNSVGAYDGTNLAGVAGVWYAYVDYSDGLGVGATPGTGSCPEAGFTEAQCSTVTTPTVGAPFMPDSNGKGVCTSGAAATVIGLNGGSPDFVNIWGAGIGFDLDFPGEVDGSGGVKGQYDASAHGITGIAFDIDAVPPGGNFRLEFPTEGTESNAAYWEGPTQYLSPIGSPGHKEIRWSDVGGPDWLSSPPLFDPTKLESVWFHVVSNALYPVDYSFCINNVIALTK
jgi:hypothetical protein